MRHSMLRLPMPLQPQDMVTQTATLRDRLSGRVAEEAAIALAAAMGYIVSSPQEAADMMSRRTYRCAYFALTCTIHVCIVPACVMPIVLVAMKQAI